MDRDLSELVFHIPVRIDTDDRLNNLLITVNFLSKNFPDSKIQVVEDSLEPSLKHIFEKSPNVEYLFIHGEERFSKSRTINYGLSKTNCKFFCVYDADVLITPAAVYKSIEILLKKDVAVILPHNGVFVNVIGETKRYVAEKLDINSIKYFNRISIKPLNKDLRLYYIPSGVVIFDRETLKLAGGYHRMMVSYGWEDIEILKRLSRIGYDYFSLYGYNVIHLDHARGVDSKPGEYFNINKGIFNKTIKLKGDEFFEYLKTDIGADSQIINKIKKKSFFFTFFTFSKIRFILQRIYCKFFILK